MNKVSKFTFSQTPGEEIWNAILKGCLEVTQPLIDDPYIEKSYTMGHKDNKHVTSFLYFGEEAYLLIDYLGSMNICGVHEYEDEKQYFVSFRYLLPTDHKYYRSQYLSIRRLCIDKAENILKSYGIKCS